MAQRNGVVGRRGILVGVLVLGAGGLGGAATAASLAPGQPGEWTPPGDTIVRVTGDAANGFGVHLYDGTALYPPTDSEALAECSEYSTWRERLVCRTEVRVWYADLAETKRAINWARYDARSL